MATQDLKTSEQQQRQSQGTQTASSSQQSGSGSSSQQSGSSSQQSGSSSQQSGTGSQQSGLARRGGYDPFGFALAPSEFFRMSPFSLMGGINPFSLMRRMTEEMDRVFGDSARDRGESGWMPAIEVTQRDNTYVVRAELAGLKPEDVKVEVVEDNLILEGERKYEHEENQEGVHRTERRYGRFFRVIPLPEGAKAEQARAKFDNGVLEIELPMPEQQSNRRQIPIEGGSAGTQAGSSGSSGSTTDRQAKNR